MILHPHKLIYVHIPKTGGRSIEKAFSFEPVSRIPIDDPFSARLVERETEKHLPAAVLRRSFPDVFHSYFKACHVRNSWDYFVSAYSWLKSGCGLRHEFKHWIMNGFPGTPVREANIFLKPCQLDWITDESGSIIVDFIGRFENLQLDFDRICERTGSKKRRLPHFNKTEHMHYSHYYDRETKQYIHELYKKDIEYFGFTFETD